MSKADNQRRGAASYDRHMEGETGATPPFIAENPNEQTLLERLLQSEGSLWELNTWLYEHPEVAWEEHQSCRRVAAFLEESGFAVELPAYGLDTAFVARAGSNGGPHVVLCAEFDALPEIGHACGHNLIASISSGAGHALLPLADELGFRLTVLGTPAEECAGGKVRLLEAGAFEGVDAALMVHPTPVDVLDPPMLAVSTLEVEFNGKASHAALAPDNGVNALDAFVVAYNAISVLRQQLPDTDRIHGIVVNGGDAVNVVPERTVSTWCIRAADAAALARTRARVEECFRAGALATGCELSVREAAHDYHDLVSDQQLAASFERAAERVGRHCRRSRPGEVFGSTDLGNVSQRVPSLHPFFALGDGIPNHDRRFADLTITPEARQLIAEGALALALTVVDVVTSKDSTAVPK